MADKPKTIFMAVDPGGTGSYHTAIDGLKDIIPYNLDSDQDFIDHVADLYEEYEGNVVAILEAVPCFAGKNIPSFTAFKLGKHCGFIEGVFRTKRIPVHLISPRKWQMPIKGLGKKTGHARKRAIREAAAILYPHIRPTVRNADSLMMLHYFFCNNNQKS